MFKDGRIINQHTADWLPMHRMHTPMHTPMHTHLQALRGIEGGAFVVVAVEGKHVVDRKLPLRLDGEGVDGWIGDGRLVGGQVQGRSDQGKNSVCTCMHERMRPCTYSVEVVELGRSER